MFENVIPILPVRDLQASVDFYVGLLGFHVNWQHPGIFASVSRDRATLFLCEGDQGHAGTWVWVGVQDVDALFREYSGKGAKIRNPPTNYPWACEMQIEDADGNVLRMGSDSKPDKPNGEWLDMKGRKWPVED